MEHLGVIIEVEGLWIEDSQSRFEDSIMPLQHLLHMLLFVLCCESRYFEDIVKFSIFRLRTIYDFFQVCLEGWGGLKGKYLFIKEFVS